MLIHYTYYLSIYLLHTLITTFIFFFNATATTEIYTLSLHDALPIFQASVGLWQILARQGEIPGAALNDSWQKLMRPFGKIGSRSEEHTSELQSRENLVCRLLLEKKKKKKKKEINM